MRPSLKAILLAPAAAAALLLVPVPAPAQVDAVLGAVTDILEPTPVSDAGMQQAAGDLAGKIDRLNRVLFGGSEENTAAWRYRTMYGELYELTSAFGSFVERAYGNARRLERLYATLDGGSLHDHAAAAQAAWDTCEGTVRGASALIDRFRKVFASPDVTNAEVRRAAAEALEELDRVQAEEERRIDAEVRSARLAAGLAECAEFLTPSGAEYVRIGREMYGPPESAGGTTGPLGAAVMALIGLLCAVYGAFAGYRIMNGTPNARSLLSRLLFVIVFSLVVLLTLRRYV